MSILKNTVKRTASVTVACITVAVIAVALVGCSFFDFLFGGDFIEFTRSSIVMQVGDTYDLSSVIESDVSSYELTSTDARVVSVNGTTATALNAGVAYIVAETDSYSDRIKVTVTDAQSDGLTVTANGELVQTMGATTEIAFVPSATGGVAALDVVWNVNGETAEILPSDESFVFFPTAAGIYEITATAGEFTASQTVRCYYAVDASAECSDPAKLTQTSSPYAPVEFSVSVRRNAENPEDYIEWYADGELLYAGGETSFVYKPTAGRHTLRAYVNGNRIYAADGFFRGSVVPSAPTVRFDNVFPHVYIEFDVAGHAQVEIDMPNGVIGVYSQTDARYAPLFDGGRFDAGEIITLCSDLRKEYTIRVKSLGDNDVYTESEYSESCVLTQIPSAAKKYLDSLCLSGDHYVTSDIEYVELVEYYVNFRQKTTSEPKVAFECYVAYDMSGTAEDLWNDSFQIAATSGMYRNISVTERNGVMRTSFTVNTVNAPTAQACDDFSSKEYSKQLHAILPHINYDDALYRPAGYVFPIDEREITASVTYTDELYLAAQRNVRPVPMVGSAAYTVYEQARSVLRKICTDGMTDVQKAHAIYDWIMWQVTYDTPATYTDAGERYSAYYMEGVFGDGATRINGKIYDPYAVCDGMSKAYSLMCNIEGVPCVRVVGTAGDSVQDAGGHAWNKVFVNGGWYVVDCTWGDSTATLDIDGRRADYELGLHDHLFLTDAQVAHTHFEPYMSGDSSITYAPATAENKLDIYATMPMGETTVDCTVKSRHNPTERLREISTAFAKSYKTTKTIVVPGGPNGGRYDIDRQAFEIKIDGALGLSDANIKATITGAIRKVRPLATVRVYDYDGIILVLMSDI